jgi:hypothetical protein
MKIQPVSCKAQPIHLVPPHVSPYNDREGGIYDTPSIEALEQSFENASGGVEDVKGNKHLLMKLVRRY